LGVGNPSLSPGLATGAFTGFEGSASALLWSGRGPYLPTQCQASYHSASSGSSVRPSSSCFDDANDEAIVHVNTDIATGHADVRMSAVMADADDDDDDDNAEDGDFV